MALICLLFSAMLWTGLLVQLNIERERIIESKRQENDKLARVFEEHVARTIRAAEVTLRNIGEEYQRLGRKFNLAQYAKDRGIYLDPYNVLSVVDANGNLALSTSPPSTPTNYRKYDNYRYHTQHETSNIYISRPRIGDTTGKWTVYLSCRMNKADGSFGGNVTVGMDPTYFSRIYSELGLGKDSVVSLIGRDGIIRARAMDGDGTVGQNVADSGLFIQRLPAANHGNYVGMSPIDQITRIYSYRALKDYPLVVLIGTSQTVALADHDRRRFIYVQAAGAMTAVILSLGLFALFQIARSEREYRERRRGERLLSRSEQRLNEAQRIARIGNWELDLVSGTLTWSDEIFRIFEIDQTKFGATYEAFLNAIHPEDREVVNAAYTGSLVTRKPYDITHRLRMADGRIKYVHERCESEFNAEGTPLKSVGTVQDITERKLADQALAESHRLLQTIINTTPVRIFWKDRELRYLGCNPVFARDAGAAHPDDLLGKDDYQLGWRAQAELYRVDDRQVMDSGIPKLSYEEPQTTPDGHCIWLRTSKVPLRNEANETIGVLGVYEDITEYKHAEEEILKLNTELERRVEERTSELQSANKELETFSYSVAHDLRAPLRGIDGYSRLLLAEHAAGLDDGGRGFLQNIVRATQHMSQLLEDLLAYSRLERRDMQLGQVNPQELIKSLLAERVDEIKTRGVAVSVAVACPSVTADREGLTMALRNLLENALKFTRNVPQPMIEIGARDTGATCILSVRDNGVGFDMKFHDKIFDIFQRLHRSEDYPGTGVGLAIVKKAMERMGGRVWAASEPGKGATFYLEIPE